MKREGWITFSVFALVVMAAWTLVIKYLAPLEHNENGRRPLGVAAVLSFCRALPIPC